MSNKANQFKNKKGKAVQIGNFHVSFEKGQLQSVKIASAAGNWNIRFREDNPLFQWISNEIKSDEGKNILKLVFSAYYAVCNGVPDNIFLEDIIKAYKSSLDRITAVKETLSEEEDKQIINEEKEKHNLLKEVENDTQN